MVARYSAHNSASTSSLAAAVAVAAAACVVDVVPTLVVDSPVSSHEDRYP